MSTFADSRAQISETRNHDRHGCERVFRLYLKLFRLKPFSASAHGLLRPNVGADPQQQILSCFVPVSWSLEFSSMK